MATKDFDSLPPELLLLLSSSLPTSSLNALTLVCHRLHDALQAELDERLTPALAKELLLSVAPSSPHLVKKFLDPPYLVNPNNYGLYGLTPLHVAARAGNMETTSLLLSSGANPNLPYDQDEYMPLHFTVRNQNLKMAALLLDHGAEVDSSWGCDGASENALQYSCSRGNLDLVKLLLAYGANPERSGHYGTALGFAVHQRKVELVKLLLDAGTDVTVKVPLFILLVGGPPLPHIADLLYLALGLMHPGSRKMLNDHMARRGRQVPDLKWEGRPLKENKKEIMAMLLAYGASKDATLALVSKHLSALAKEAKHEPEEYLELIHAMLQDAEDAIPEVIAKYS
ncbi:ankyrin repeat-containing domain protein [Mycena metata]|uniref:Ankyrin repeat-containing domain protein n=1 Tax=Mycena metata TaxID=1033252 RepID=A0AAD7IZW5_9AGAR|nr:ankyrin repeat-containing domain protein [Mycena metata]